MNSLHKAALVLLILFLLGLLAIIVLRTDGIASARLAVDAVSGWLLVFRLMVVALLWWFWNPVVEWLFAGEGHKRRSDANIAAYQAQRTKFVLGFLAIELIVVQNVLGTIFSGVL